jgi:hypothetical protein
VIRKPVGSQFGPQSVKYLVCREDRIAQTYALEQLHEVAPLVQDVLPETEREVSMIGTLRPERAEASRSDCYPQLSGRSARASTFFT